MSPDHDEENQVERLQRVQFAPADDAGEDEDEEKRGAGSKDDVH